MYLKKKNRVILIVKYTNRINLYVPRNSSFPWVDWLGEKINWLPLSLSISVSYHRRTKNKNDKPSLTHTGSVSQMIMLFFVTFHKFTTPDRSSFQPFYVCGTFSITIHFYVKLYNVNNKKPKLYFFKNKNFDFIFL